MNASLRFALWMPGTRIGELDLRARPPLVVRGTGGPDPDLPAAGHGLETVLHEVEDHLLYLVPVDLERKHLFTGIEDD